jgi:molybdopterin converting factor subunit 1
MSSKTSLLFADFLRYSLRLRPGFSSNDKSVQKLSTKLPRVTVQILLFASLKDALGCSQLALDVPEGARISDALARLEEREPKVARFLPHVRVARNLDYASPDDVLCEGDELALIPPVSGGADSILPDGYEPFVGVYEHEITLNQVVNWVETHTAGLAGATCTFSGFVRSTSRDPDGQWHDDIEFLDYEAFVPMAQAKMREIALEIAGKWDAACAIVHRTGRLKVGEASVFIAVASAHRAASFEACRFAIEELKVRVPIWKRETARDGFWWKEGS